MDDGHVRLMKRILGIISFSFLLFNFSYANEMLRLKCIPQASGQGSFNFLFNITQNKVIERNEYKVDFPIKSTKSTIAFVESSNPQKGKTPLFRIVIDRYSGEMTLVFYFLSKSEAKKFKRIIKKQYSKTGDKVSSYFIALNEFKEEGILYYNCK